MTLRIPRVALVLALLSAAPIASAQTQDTASAEATFRRGMAAMRDGRNAEAAVEFRQSYRLNPLPDVVFNLALALRGAGRFAASIGAFERYLATAPAHMPRARREAVRELLPQLRAQVASVRVEVDPADATLRVDGQTIERAANGSDVGELVAVDPRDANVLLLDAGAHSIEVLREGFRAERREITVRGGSQTSERMVLVREVPVVPVVVPTQATVTVTPHPVAAPPVAQREESPSVFTRWWFWTIAGVVVGGTVGTVVWLTRQPDAWAPGTRFDVEAVTAR